MLILDNLLKLTWEHSKTADVKEMFAQFEDAGQEAFKRNSYEFHALDKTIKPVQWQEFLSQQPVVKFIEEQLQHIKEAQNRKVRIDVGSATASVDLQKAKFIEDVARRGNQDESRPEHIYMFPKEIIELQDILKAIRVMIGTDGFSPVESDMDVSSRIHMLLKSKGF